LKGLPIFQKDFAKPFIGIDIFEKKFFEGSITK